MPSTIPQMIKFMRRIAPEAALAAAILVILPACSRVPNYWLEDGPAKTTTLETPTQQDVTQRFQASTARERGWQPQELSPQRGAIRHEASYFEDPFEDKGRGDGRTPQVDYRLDWQDYVAALYDYPRFTANWLLFPVSVVVTPPWVDMESDGVLSKQALGYDHDAERVADGSPMP